MKILGTASRTGEGLRCGILSSTVILAAIFAALIQTNSCKAQEKSAEKVAIRVYASKIVANDVNVVCKTYAGPRPALSLVVLGGQIKNYFQRMSDAPEGCLCVSSRPMTDAEKTAAAEKGLRLKERIVDKRAIGIVVNATVPTEELTLEQVVKIFTGQYTSWNQLGSLDEEITVFSRPYPEDGIAVWFREAVLKDQTVMAKAQIKDFDEALLLAVSNQKGAIGYASTRKKLPSNVRLVAIKSNEGSPAVLPTGQALNDESYPYVMRIFAYWDGKRGDREIESLVEYIKSEGM
jgi:phosphate transport system substrate-binding protein